MKSKLPYVVHFCRNKACNVGWLDLDTTNVSSRPPQNKYCIDCEVFGGMKATKDPAKVARGQALAKAAKEKKLKYACLEGLM